MKYVLLGFSILVVMIGWLAVAVFEDATADPLGECQELNDSVCSPSDACPSGMDQEPRYACPEGFRCCVSTS